MDLSIFVDESGDFDLNQKHYPNQKHFFTTKEIKTMIKEISKKKV